MRGDGLGSVASGFSRAGSIADRSARTGRSGLIEWVNTTLELRLSSLDQVLGGVSGSWFLKPYIARGRELISYVTAAAKWGCLLSASGRLPPRCYFHVKGEDTPIQYSLPSKLLLPKPAQPSFLFHVATQHILDVL